MEKDDDEEKPEKWNGRNGLQSKVCDVVRVCVDAPESGGEGDAECKQSGGERVNILRWLQSAGK